MIARKQPDEWDKYLQIALYAYRTTVHKATGYPPFLLTHGRMPTFPSESIFAQYSDSDPSKTPDDYLEKVRDVMASIYNTTDINIKQAQEAAKKNYDKLAKPAMYKVGDIVFAKSPYHKRGMFYKLAKPFIGPMRIVKINNLTATLQYVEKPSLPFHVCHVDKLSPAYTCLTNDITAKERRRLYK